MLLCSKLLYPMKIKWCVLVDEMSRLPTPVMLPMSSSW